MEHSNKDSNKALVLRTCNHNLISRNGFRWPESGPVEAPDWDPRPVCGGGLHGALWGEGDGELFTWCWDAKWLVVEVDLDEVVDLGGKVKFPRGVVVHCGGRSSATTYLVERAPGRAVIGARVIAGDQDAALAGYDGKVIVGDYGLATAGDYGEAIAGHRGKALAGYDGKATVGDYGRATVGDYGEAIAGVGGSASAGVGGNICIAWVDGDRRRVAVGYVGENGIEASVVYRVHDGRLDRLDRVI